MADPFDRMHDRLLSLLGTEAVLRGALACQVDLNLGVAVTGQFGTVVGYRDQASILNSLDPRPGDSLVTVDGKSYVLDAIESADQYATLFSLR